MPTHVIDGARQGGSVPSRQSQLQEDTAFRVLRILEQEPSVSQRELARRLGMSLGGIHYCLQALVSKGFVKLENFRANPRKLGYAYVLTPAGMAQRVAMTGRFLQRKMAEYEALQSEIEALRAEAVRLEASRLEVARLEVARLEALGTEALRADG
jgi:EPS-associated MarR family transcriptional regulator